jgi:hypothetical protein
MPSVVIPLEEKPYLSSQIFRTELNISQEILSARSSLTEETLFQPFSGDFECLLCGILPDRQPILLDIFYIKKDDDEANDD